MTTTSAPKRIDFNTRELKCKRRTRVLKKHLTHWYVFIGVFVVLSVITLVFFFFRYVVFPLFQGAGLNAMQALMSVRMQDAGKPLMLSIEEQTQVGIRVSDKGLVLFFSVKSGDELSRVNLSLPAGTQVMSIGKTSTVVRLWCCAYPTYRRRCSVIATESPTKTTKKTITPEIEGTLNPKGCALDHVNLSVNDSTLVLVGSSNVQLSVLSMAREENIITGKIKSSETRIDFPKMAEQVRALYVDPRQQWLYVVNGRAQAGVFSLHDKGFNKRYKLADDATAEITASAQLAGRHLYDLR